MKYNKEYIRLKEIREKLGVTAREFAELLGLMNQWNYYSYARRKPSMRTIIISELLYNHPELVDDIKKIIKKEENNEQSARNRKARRISG